MIFELMVDSTNPKFKDALKIIKETDGVKLLAKL
jgi:hypothetical protein